MSLGRERRNKRIVFWPVNIDEEASISEGRKIPKKHAVKRPTIDEIIRASNLLDLNPEVEESSYPRNWMSYTKRIVVDKKSSKREVLKLIASKIKELRGKH
ncbi:MAG: signal recognition particle protein Srp19 [Desulfurococcales archaeon]|nr:signal recognition particle protein Srp19 [Desulfurococcales archaeon]MEB3780335.1 signal recognition particle protein Srp19 [Desulfurococcales archaeon]